MLKTHIPHSWIGFGAVLVGVATIGLLVFKGSSIPYLSDESVQMPGREVHVDQATLQRISEEGREPSAAEISCLAYVKDCVAECADLEEYSDESQSEACLTCELDFETCLEERS